MVLQNEFELLNGDVLNVTLEEVDTPENPSRRRLLSIIREEQRTGRVLLATSAELPTPTFRLKSLKSILKGSQKEVRLLIAVAT